jgi:hypothetical protein
MNTGPQPAASAEGPLGKQPLYHRRVPLSETCKTSLSGFSFGHVLINECCLPGLDILFSSAECVVPSEVSLSRTGSLEVKWLSGLYTDFGYMHPAMVRAYKQNRTTTVTIGCTERSSVKTLQIPVKISFAEKRPSVTANAVSIKRFDLGQRNRSAVSTNVLGTSNGR